MEQLVLVVELTQLVGIEVIVEEPPLALQSVLIESLGQSKLLY